LGFLGRAFLRRGGGKLQNLAHLEVREVRPFRRMSSSTVVPYLRAMEKSVSPGNHLVNPLPLGLLGKPEHLAHLDEEAFQAV
jgi:hypothetical protein